MLLPENKEGLSGTIFPPPETRPERKGGAEVFAELVRPEGFPSIRHRLLELDRVFENKSAIASRFAYIELEPEDVLVVLREKKGCNVIGYTYATPAIEERVANVKSTVIEPAYRGQGFVEKLMDVLDEELRQKGYKHLIRDAVVAHGYADRLLKRYGDRVEYSKEYHAALGAAKEMKIKL